MKTKPAAKTQKALCILIVLCLALPFFCGCDGGEIETLAIVSGLAVDAGAEKKFKVTAEIIAGSEQNATKPLCVSGEGDTVAEAVRTIQSPDGKPLYLSHCKVCVLSSAASSKAIYSLVDWAGRDPEARLTMNLFLAKENAAAILETAPLSGVSVGFNLFDAVNKDSKKVANITIHDFTNLREQRGKAAYIPAVSIAKSGEISIPALVFFRGNAPAFEVVADEFFPFSLMKGDRAKQLFTVTNGDKGYSVWLKPKRQKIAHSYERGRLAFDISLEFSADLSDISLPFDPYNRGARETLERELEASIKGQLLALISRTTKDNPLDIFCFGAKIYRQNPELFSEIEQSYAELYSAADFNISVCVTLNSSGVSGQTVFGGGDSN